MGWDGNLGGKGRMACWHSMDVLDVSEGDRKVLRPFIK